MKAILIGPGRYPMYPKTIKNLKRGQGGYTVPEAYDEENQELQEDYFIYATQSKHHTLNVFMRMDGDVVVRYVT